MKSNTQNKKIEAINEKTLVKPTFEMDVEVKIPSDMPMVEHNLDNLKEYALNLNTFYKNNPCTNANIKVLQYIN